MKKLQLSYRFNLREPVSLSISVLNSTGKVWVLVQEVLIMLGHSEERLPSSKWLMKSSWLLRSWGGRHHEVLASRVDRGTHRKREETLPNRLCDAY